MEETESARQLSELCSPIASPKKSRLPAPTDDRLIIPTDLLVNTLAGLAQRSAGWRESAAIWVGSISEGEWHAERVYFHHELCDDHGGPLFLELAEGAKFRLYQQLAIEKLRVVALIHTHPEDWVGLSPIDQSNQLSSRIGFWSIVVPNYAQSPHILVDMGVHLRANNGWYQLDPQEIVTRVVVKV
jgi:hypothetical protein